MDDVSNKTRLLRRPNRNKIREINNKIHKSLAETQYDQLIVRFISIIQTAAIEQYFFNKHKKIVLQYNFVFKTRNANKYIKNFEMIKKLKQIRGVHFFKI